MIPTQEAKTGDKQMHRMKLAAAGLSALIALAPSTVRADNIWDVTNARANARAGGPVSEYDRELLGRWGCESGTQSAYCQQIKHGANSGGYRAYRRRARR
jgi:hypothetical protein